MFGRAPDEIAADAQSFRRSVRRGDWTGPTTGVAHGALQANLAVLPASHAAAFEAYCQMNPRPCPLLGRTKPGGREISELARDLDITRDVPAYRVLRDGEPAERIDTLESIWTDDTVVFAIGCSFSFEAAMENAGIPVRHWQRQANVPMYVSNIDTRPSGPFGGKMVVSMRGVPAARASELHALCAQFPFAHGAPVHIGDPAEIGIADTATPDFGDAPHVEPGDVLAFWACGVTAQMALRHARLPLAAAHEPGHMLVTDLDASAPGLAAWAAA
ncbi:MAG: putative hydro-lyase [Pseudomonadota bacterium]